MLIKAVIAGAVFAGALPVAAVSVAAQERGTVEFGAFGSAATFDRGLSLTTAVGGGGRVGMFLDPRWSMEFEDAEMRARRPHGLQDVNVGLLSGRLVAAPVKSGRLSLLVGAGAGVSTETNFLHSYGVDALVGAKLAINSRVAVRVDGVLDWLANEHWKTYKSVRAGLVVYRHPATRMQTAVVAAPAPMLMVQRDSVSAAETRRLRERDTALMALRDSLRNTSRTEPVPASMVPPPAAVTTMQARIHFAFDQSELTDSAKAILDEKVQIFRANPGMSVVLTGFTDVKGGDAYNLALGMRRAQAAKAYIVAKGIDARRLSVESKGEREQIPGTAGAAGEAPNRRAVFQVLIAADGAKP
jgi:outer membrane protein OmpA-like peptidoglycan-associated protein